MKSLRLNDDASIPILGFGTWEIGGEKCVDAVSRALEVGYRHIDTADRYENHREVGLAIKKGGLKREELFVTTKTFYDELTHEAIIKNGSRFLEELQINYIDLLLVHWPNRSVPFEETFNALNQLKEKGIIKAVGVSNFTPHHIEDALKTGVEITNNQVELHPTFNQTDLKNYCYSKGIVLTAYSPLGRGSDLENPTVTELSKKYGVSPAQVILNWITARGIVAIPKSTTPERIKDNFHSLDWEMAPEDIEKMNSIPQGPRLLVPQWEDFDY
jgi:diketogulonate reductase-like aldo/keto reductase